VREDRAAWLLVGLGIAFYCAGDSLWFAWIEHRRSPPFPSASDALWLTFYVLVIASIAIWIHAHVRVRQRTLWLDGMIGGLTVASVGLPLIMSGGIGFAGNSTVATIVNSSYPVLDLSLLAAIAAVLAVTGWHSGFSWTVFGGGLALLAVSHITFLTMPTTASLGSGLRPMYTLSMLMLGVAAWQTTRDVAEVDMRSVRVVILPSIFALAAAGVLGYGAFRHVPAFAVGLALAALVGVVCRTWITVREIQALTQAHAAALRDELTGLGNRRLLYEAVERQVGHAGPLAPTAVLLLDLDSFKELNDVLGHAVGDSLLIEVASRLRETIRAGDVIVRMGGDEFAILLEGPADATTAQAAATRIRSALERSFLLDGIELHVGASIGAALYPEHGDDAQTLLRRADIAMYDAKSRGNSYQVYDPESEDADTRARLVLLEELRHAIANGEIEVHYQPKAALVTGEILGAEALVRWRHPTRGLLAPGAFLAAAERIGILPALTRLVLGQALSDCAAWRAAGHDLSVAINLATSDLHDPGLPGEVAVLLARHGTRPGGLHIEITEEGVLSDPIRARAVLEAISAAGAVISLDDFGTGYSSLARLAELPVDELKIDRSFVAHMMTDPGHGAIVRSTIHLAHDLGLNVVAEGIELQSQWDRLAELGCDEAQGYLLSRPLPARELEELLDGRCRRAA
jgi:diguanylate cyclase (GGDEF)-like protein